MLVVDDQSKPTLFGISLTGHTIGIEHWMPLVMCENCPCSFMRSDCIWLAWVNLQSLPWRPSDHWTKASELVDDKSQGAGERIKANWEVEKPISTNNEVQSGHPTASWCMLGATWWSAAWATRREKVRPMHGKALSRRPNNYYLKIADHLMSMAWVPGSFRYLVFVRWFPTFLFH